MPCVLSLLKMHPQTHEHRRTSLVGDETSSGSHLNVSARVILLLCANDLFLYAMPLGARMTWPLVKPTSRYMTLSILERLTSRPIIRIVVLFRLTFYLSRFKESVILSSVAALGCELEAGASPARSDRRAFCGWRCSIIVSLPQILSLGASKWLSNGRNGVSAGAIRSRVTIQCGFFAGLNFGCA